MRFFGSLLALSGLAAFVAAEVPFDPIYTPGNNVVKVGDVVTITWDPQPAEYDSESIAIDLIGGQTQNTQIYLYTIAPNVINSVGRYVWTVPADSSGLPFYGLIISINSRPGVMQYSNPFNIAAAAVPSAPSSTTPAPSSTMALSTTSSSSSTTVTAGSSSITASSVIVSVSSSTTTTATFSTTKGHNSTVTASTATTTTVPCTTGTFATSYKSGPATAHYTNGTAVLTTPAYGTKTGAGSGSYATTTSTPKQGSASRLAGAGFSLVGAVAVALFLF